MRQNLIIAVAVSIWVMFITSILYSFNIGEIKPINDSQLIKRGVLCNDKTCSKSTTIKLPYFVPMELAAQIKTEYLRFEVELVPKTEQVLAIYLPKVADNVSIRFNDVLVRQIELGTRSWNQPILTDVSGVKLRSKKNKIDIELSGNPQEGLEIFPFYIGAHEALKTSHTMREDWSKGIAKFSFGLMIILFVFVGSLWLVRREEKTYLWLSLSCLSACVFLVHFGYNISYIPYKFWTLAWSSSIYFYVFFVMKFINHFLKLPNTKLQNVNLVFVVTSILVGLVTPAQFAFLFTVVITVATLILALDVLYVFWKGRQNSKRLDFVIIYSILSLAMALGLYEQIMDYANEPARNLHLLPYMPLVMTCVNLWMIMSRLLSSLTEFETLTNSLSDTIDQKTNELATTYKNLAKAEKLKAVDEERERIMLDLHDGIGGQLVNSLAYMENKNVGDEVLRNALEEALRDLALMLDSLENDDSITTLLGMLRTRLETLLEANGLEFDWRIGEEPVLKMPSPSNNLHLARIVQEAITNIIKHADASVITVTTNASIVSIADNGRGFSAKSSPQKLTSHGIVGMHRRAEQLDGKLYIISDDTGTIITLKLS